MGEISRSKHSITMPAALSAGVQARVGSREFSGYVSSAVARRLERDALDELIAAMEESHGPVGEDAVAAIMDRLTRLWEIE